MTRRGGVRVGHRLGLVATLAVLGALASVQNASAAFDCGSTMVTCQTQVDNTGRVWFLSNELLTEDAVGDGSRRHGVLQVFLREGSSTTLLKGPNGKPIPYGERHRYSARVNGVSPDGERIYISTEASLTPDDHDVPFTSDSSVDGYELAGGQYTLITTGPVDESTPDPFGCCGASIVWASDNGSHVFFVTNDRMTEDDLDSSRDVYERSGGRTRLVSTGPDVALPDPDYSERAPDAEFLGGSTDGTTVYFATYQQLTADDTEKMTSDIYSWHNGETKRITHTVRYPEDSGQPFESFWPANYGGAATDGSIFYSASSPQTPDDTNAHVDLYRARPTGVTERLTPNLPALSGTDAGQSQLGVGTVSHDGRRLFFTTNRALLPEDRDDKLDIYVLFTATGGLRLISLGASKDPPKDPQLTLSGISRDGKRAYFSTWEQLSPEDTDDAVDVYEWTDGRIRLATPGGDSRRVGSFFQSISPNGRYVVFDTFEELVPSDGDAKSDLYLVDMGAAPQADASASAFHPRKRRRHRRRLRLVSAESIPPRMWITRQGTFSSGVAHLRLGCPKSERSGPCHGSARILKPHTRKRLAAGKFRIRTGRKGRLLLKLRHPPGSRKSVSVLARVRGVDRLGNAAIVTRRVILRRSH